MKDTLLNTLQNALIGLLLVFSLSSCTSTPVITDVAFKGVTVEDLVEKPDRDLMRKPPEKAMLSYGMDNGQAGVVISNNNVRANTIEHNNALLQQYVCNLFKESAGEVCDK